MALPVLLAENFFSRGAGGQFPSHTISAEEEPVGYEAFRVATARRHGLNYATASTANSAWYLRVVCDRIRAANCVILDRGHNLTGQTITVYASNDAHTTNETAFSGVLPTVSTPGNIDDQLGIRTEEGAWIKRFPTRVGKYWEFNVAAMGSGLSPQVPGLWLGLALELTRLPDMPFAEDTDELVQQVVESDAGWMGRTRGTPRRTGALAFRLESQSAYSAFRYQVQGLFGQGHPMWLIVDADQTERAMLVVRAPQTPMGFGYGADWWNMRRGVISYLEHEPLVP
jgi:hypothetical protein